MVRESEEMKKKEEERTEMKEMVESIAKNGKPLPNRWKASQGLLNAVN